MVSSQEHVSQCMTVLTHWGRVTHICVSKISIISSDNGLSPGRRQAIIWTSVGILLIGPLGTNFSEILNEIYTFSFKKMHLKMSSGKWRPFCLGLNVLITAKVGVHRGWKCIMNIFRNKSMAWCKTAITPLLTHLNYCSLAQSHPHVDHGLTHWGRVTHICISNLAIIGSDNGLPPARRQAIIWNNAGILLIEPLGTKFSEISVKSEFKHFHSRKCTWKCRLRNGIHFVSASMC